MVGNMFVWSLYEKVMGQVIVAGMGEPLGIRFDAIEFIFDLYEVTDTYDRQEYFEKIQKIDSVRLGYRKKELIKQQYQHHNKNKSRRPAG
jgi:hypothetical protein